MNIATGGGTLVHEIVHPFMAANFPGCPAWFNEGLGSLYEQCGEDDGHIRGYTNWRLAGPPAGDPQEAHSLLEDAPARPATASSTKRTAGTNYAQARYLCYYLQERGLLREVLPPVRGRPWQGPGRLRDAQGGPGRDDMEAFQKEWEAFVLKLQFP